MKIIKCKKPLKLKNKGELEIVFIGTGTAFGKKLYNNNLIIIKGDTHLLVDFGMTGPIALHKTTGVDISDIRNLLITHSHADHIGGLEYLALYHRYVVRNGSDKPDLKMIISKDYEKILWNMSLRGGMEWNETNSKGMKLSFSDYFDPIRPDKINSAGRLILGINFEGLQLEMFGTNHIPDNAETQADAFATFGVFVDNRVFISGDTKFDPELINLYADRSEILFHDASFFPNPVHTSVGELNTLPKKLKKRIFLMHYDDNYESHKITGFGGFALQGYRYIFE